MGKPKTVSDRCTFCGAPGAVRSPYLGDRVCMHCFTQMRPTCHSDIIKLEAELAREQRLGLFPAIRKRLGG